MGESSVITVKMPSNFRSGKGAVTEAEMRARTLCNSQLEAVRVNRGGFVSVPRLPQCDVCNTVFVAKRELDVTKSVECAPIQPNVFTQGFEYECPLVT